MYTFVTDSWASRTMLLSELLMEPELLIEPELHSQHSYGPLPQPFLWMTPTFHHPQQ